MTHRSSSPFSRISADLPSTTMPNHPYTLNIAPAAGSIETSPGEIRLLTIVKFQPANLQQRTSRYAHHSYSSAGIPSIRSRTSSNYRGEPEIGISIKAAQKLAANLFLGNHPNCNPEA